jgi:hypothetical protein
MMKIRAAYFGVFLSLVGLGPAWAQSFLGDASGLKAAVAVDIVGKKGEAGLGTEDRLDVREAEVLLFSPVDHLFHGMLNAAAHLEENGAFFEIHEAYLGSTKLIPRSRLRLGQFFLAIGRLNQVHRHDWPFVSAPKVQSEFFDPEGASDTGVEFATLLPTRAFWDITVGVTNGWTFGHSHSLGEKPETPTHYLRSAHYFDLPNNGGTQIGLNYLGRRDAAGTDSQFFGVDATAKWRDGKRLAFLFQSEVWGRVLDPENGEAETTLGAYVYPQYGVTSQFQVGIRGDAYSVLSLEDALGKSVNNGTYALVPTLTYRPSEFSTFRLAYTYATDKPTAAPAETKYAIELQATFILGAHPAHDF